jgi:hypothetical protein
VLLVHPTLSAEALIVIQSVSVTPALTETQPVEVKSVMWLQEYVPNAMSMVIVQHHPIFSALVVLALHAKLICTVKQTVNVMLVVRQLLEHVIYLEIRLWIVLLQQLFAFLLLHQVLAENVMTMEIAPAQNLSVLLVVVPNADHQQQLVVVLDRLLITIKIVGQILTVTQHVSSIVLLLHIIVIVAVFNVLTKLFAQSLEVCALNA